MLPHISTFTDGFKISLFNSSGKKLWEKKLQLIWFFPVKIHRIIILWGQQVHFNTHIISRLFFDKRCDVKRSSIEFFYGKWKNNNNNDVVFASDDYGFGFWKNTPIKMLRFGHSWKIIKQPSKELQKITQKSYFRYPIHHYFFTITRYLYFVKNMLLIEQ